MKRQRLIAIFLLFAMTFSSLHAFAIDLLDTDHCSTQHYVLELEQSPSAELHGDVCDIHHAFHVPFVLLETLHLFNTPTVAEIPLDTVLGHDFFSYDNFLKPPITLS